MSAHVHSKRLDHEVFFGKEKAKPLRSGTLRYEEDVRPGLVKAGVAPPTPAMFGHGHNYPQGKWLMLGNGPDDSVFPGFEGCGDCGIAGPYHEEMEVAKDSGAKAVEVDGKRAVETYSEYTLKVNGEAYDPHSGSGDTGVDVQEVNAYREAGGIKDNAGVDYKILKSVAIDPGNLQHIWECAWLAERVGIGIVVTEANMDQFDAAPQPTWEYVKGSPELGGHYVPVVGKLGLLSWAEDVYYTPRFIQHQCDEAYVTFTPLVLKKNGLSAEGFDLADIEAWTVALAKAKLKAMGLI